jgi:hypothetical protein
MLFNGVGQLFGPVAAHHVNPADLLLSDASVPFRVQQDQSSAWLVQAQPLLTHYELRHQRLCKALGSVEGLLNHSAGLWRCAVKPELSKYAFGAI